MKQVNFNKVRFENFCCYIEPMEYEFKNNKISVIVGPNGSGKTTIFDSIYYSLYGTTSKGLKSDDVVNEIVGKNCHCFVEFNIDEDKYKAERFVKDSKEGDSVYLYKNNELIKKGHREVVPEIERILLPQKLFTNTLFFGQKVKTFFTDCIDSEQKEIFRKVLQLDNYIDWYKYSDKLLKEVSSKDDELSENSRLNKKLLEDCKEQIIKLKIDKEQFLEEKSNTINILNKKLISFNDIISTCKDETFLDILVKDLSNFKDNIQDSKLEYERLKNDKISKINDLNTRKEIRKGDLDNKYISKKSELHKDKNIELMQLSENNKNITTILEKDISRFTSDIKNIEKNNLEINKSIKLLEKEINEIESSLEKELPICFACKQKIGEFEKKELEELLNNKKNELEILNINISKNISFYKETKDNLTLSEKEYYEITSKYKEEKSNIENNFKKETNDLENSYRETTSKLDSILTSKTLEVENEFSNILKNCIENIKNIEDSIKNCEKNILDLKLELKNRQSYIIEVEKIKESIKEIENREFNDSMTKDLLIKELKLNEHLESIDKERLSLENLIECYEFWKSAFSMTGIPAMLIDESIPFMNNRVSYYLEQAGSRYLVSFDTVNETKSGEYRDKIKINILDTITKASDRKKLSSGQIRLIDIAIIFTLRDLQSSIQDMFINIILLDEIFDSLDEENITYVSSMLRRMSKNQSINIISHRQIDQIESDEIYRTI